MTQVSRSLSLPASPADVWKVIGQFQGLPDWHPAVAQSEREEIDGVEHRRLSLVGGGEILEKSWGGDGQSYGYEIIASPLPVSRYRANISVTENEGGGSTVTWSSSFEATADGAADAIAGIYEAGFKSLKEKFG